ncbi:MAG: efflux RND transporter periplasmic adaptor subunit [Alphaproteobacteria bacterium]
MMKKLRWVFALLMVVGAYGGLKWLKHAQKPIISSTNSALSVTVITPINKNLERRLSITGVTTPREEVVVASELTGIKVENILVDVGQKVKKGQKLAILDNESLNNQLKELQSDEERANDEYRRVEAMQHSDAVSKETVMQKRTAKQMAQAKLEQAKLNLRRTIITAPADGLIFERNLAIGSLINANQPLFRLALAGEIEMAAEVPETDLSSLKTEQPAMLNITGNPQPLAGKIRLITPQINNNRMASIRISFNQTTNLPVGLFGNAEIITGTVAGSLLPATALQQDSNGSYYVWQLNKEHRAHYLPVTVKLRTNEEVLVNDLPPDTSIVARAGAFLQEGDMVNIVGAE